MDISEPRSSDSEQNRESSNRRKSGRAVRKPQLYSQDARIVNTSEKRKRATVNDDEEDDDEIEEESESEDDPEDEDPDEEEEKERKRAAARRAANKRRQNAKSNPKPASSSRATKKARTDNAGKSLAIRPAGNSRRTKKTAPKKRTAPPRPIFHATAEGMFGKFSIFFIYISLWSLRLVMLMSI